MPCLVEYAPGKLLRVVCPTGVGGLPDSFHRRFGCGRHNDIPSHGYDLREPLIRFHRTAPSPLRTTRSDEQRDGPDNLNSCVSSGRTALCAVRDRRPPISWGQSEAAKCWVPGKLKPALRGGTTNTSQIRCRSSATLNGFGRSGMPEAPPERSTSACPDISITLNSR